MARNFLDSSLRDASFSIIFQVLFRCITFVLNAFIIRTVGHEALGIMNVRLLLLESTILFLSKEPLLKACLSNTKSHNWAQVVNQIWISIPISAVLSVFLVYIWLHVLSPVEEQYLTQYEWGCYLMALSCIIEVSSQSVIIVAQSFCFVKLKIVLETLHIVSRTVIFVYLVKQNPNEAIRAFSVAQIVSVLVFCLAYYLFFAWYISHLKTYNENKKDTTREINVLFRDMEDFPFGSIWDFFPGKLCNDDKFLNKNLGLLSISFAKQSVVKQFLTEGERYVMTVSPVMSFTEQSLYDIVNNLGSLAARFIFRPIEDSAYFYFTQMINRGIPVKDQNKKSISESALVLKQLCNVILSIGLVILVFGQSYSYTLLNIYGGQKLVENDLVVSLLKFHCFAVVLLAINGVTEGFVFAMMSKEELDRYNYIMVFFSVLFLLVSYLLTLIVGPVGFIIANCINMLARIMHSVHYISNMYSESSYKPLMGLQPRWKFLGILIVSAYFTKMSEVFILPTSAILHIFVGSIFFSLTLIVWAFENKDLMFIGYRKYKNIFSIKNE